jgi:hypothetical protein
MSLSLNKNILGLILTLTWCQISDLQELLFHGGNYDELTKLSLHPQEKHITQHYVYVVLKLGASTYCFSMCSRMKATNEGTVLISFSRAGNPWLTPVVIVFSGGIVQEDQDLRFTRANCSWFCILKYPTHKWRVFRMTHVVLSQFCKCETLSWNPHKATATKIYLNNFKGMHHCKLWPNVRKKSQVIECHVWTWDHMWHVLKLNHSKMMRLAYIL